MRGKEKNWRNAGIKRNSVRVSVLDDTAVSFQTSAFRLHVNDLRGVQRTCVLLPIQPKRQHHLRMLEVAMGGSHFLACSGVGRWVIAGWPRAALATIFYHVRKGARKSTIFWDAQRMAVSGNGGKGSHFQHLEWWGRAVDINILLAQNSWRGARHGGEGGTQASGGPPASSLFSPHLKGCCHHYFVHAWDHPPSTATPFPSLPIQPCPQSIVLVSRCPHPFRQ